VSSSSLTNFASPTLIISPALSIADWSQIDNTYQINVAAANQIIQDYLNSSHNTWNYPSPGSDRPTMHLDAYSPLPLSSIVATLPNFLHILADIATQQAYIVSPQLQYPLAPKHQDAYIHLQFEEVVERVPLADIPVENLLPSIAEAPIAIVAFPALPTPVLPNLPLPITPEAKLFPHLFTALPYTTTVANHPHQYTVIYEHGKKIWCPQDKYIHKDFLLTILCYNTLDNHLAFFVMPFHTHCYYDIQLAANGPLPNIHLCAKVSRHPPSLHFPFGYIESSFIDSIKFLFRQFPPTWLEYFEGALILLTAYDFLDGHIATLVGHLYFTVDGIFVIHRNTRTKDLLYTQLHLAQFMCMPQVPTRPFLHITPPSIEEPL
jgi:hypothetical protein